MRFIGGKTNLLSEIENTITTRTENVNSIIDIFSGSGAVAAHFKSKGFDVIGNDIMYFSYALSRGNIGLDEKPAFSKVAKNPIDHLNKLPTDDIEKSSCFIYQNYAPHDDNERMYFQPGNALKIDVIRQQIESWKEQSLLSNDEYFYLLASLISAVPYVSNITGVYGAYLKHWDKRTYNALELKEPTIIKNGSARFYNENCDDLLPEIKGDLLYADPPYNSRQYLPNYHVLETIARYDSPSIRGVTGMRDYESQKSDFCIKGKVEAAFERLIETANVRYVLISYNNEGLLSTKTLSELCQSRAKANTFSLQEIDFRRYNNVGTKPGGVKEQLYFFEKQ